MDMKRGHECCPSSRACSICDGLGTISAIAGHTTKTTAHFIFWWNPSATGYSQPSIIGHKPFLGHPVKWDTCWETNVVPCESIQNLWFVPISQLGQAIFGPFSYCNPVRRSLENHRTHIFKPANWAKCTYSKMTESYLWLQPKSTINMTYASTVCPGDIVPALW